ncbi:MAG: hypothetical protein U9R58_13890 [Chloroflexota bacterium]|nr:hypothetical protein [Chloroflexota bacterium]
MIEFQNFQSLGVRFRSDGDQTAYYEFTTSDRRNDASLARIDGSGARETLGTGKAYIARDTPYKITIMAIGDQIEIYLDDELLISAEDDALSGDTNLFWVDQTIDVSIDDVKFWNLEGVEIGAQAETPAVASQINDVLDYISEQSPTFEDDFSTANPEWGSFDNVVADGVLHYVGTDEGVNLIPSTGLLDASDFAIAFDFNFAGQFGNPRDKIGLRFRSTGDTYYDFNIEPGMTYWYVNKVDQGFTRIDSGGVSGKYGTVLVVAQGDQIAVFLDDQLLTEFQDSDITGIQNFIYIAAGLERVIDIDNVRFWNLDGVEIGAQEMPTPTPSSTEETSAFYDPILAYLEEGHVAFQDDFTNTDKYDNNEGFWQMRTDVGSWWSENGYKFIQIREPFDEMTFPLFGYINTTDFAIQYDIEFPTGGQQDGFGLYFRASNNLDAYYKILFDSFGGWKLTQDSKFTELGSGSSVFEPFEFNTFLIIAKQENLAIFVNGELIIEVNDLEFAGSDNFLVATAEDHLKYLRLDNFKFWNLNGVDF